MAKYTQIFQYTFSVPSQTSNGEDLTPAALRAGLLRHLYQLSDEELLNACGVPQAHIIEEKDPQHDYVAYP